jgi:UDP-N-acetylmuramoyl-L-alanyl-D-glutamate--2,6-diaminopimelate ligase
MGKLASEYSDKVIVTADNPRNEDPVQISNEIIKGMKSDNYESIIDREEAIKKAIHTAEKGDLVIILGKGHETTQTLKDRTIPFNDYSVAEEILSKNIQKQR